MSELFDHQLRALRRDRAVRQGAETFLYDRAFDDCLERLADVRRRFERVLIAGCPNPDWLDRLKGSQVTAIDPGPLMAKACGGVCADLESLPFDAGEFDLVISVGLLDTANNLPLAAAAFALVLEPGGLLLGAVSGGNSLPRLRNAMLLGDAAAGEATPHVHPRIEAASLAQLLSTAGLVEPVVDVDRVQLSYPSLQALVHDLRAMGATNVLRARSHRPLLQRSLEAAQSAFLEGQDRAQEQVEILHFAAWKPA